MLDLNDFFYFVQAVDRGGSTAAGRTLRIPKSALSHRIQQLEAIRQGLLPSVRVFVDHLADKLPKAVQM
jgi:hypothetical protein